MAQTLQFPTENLQKKYIVKWSSFDISLSQEVGKEMEFHDVQFDDFIIRARNDDTGVMLYIPYDSIYDIEVVVI